MLKLLEAYASRGYICRYTMLFTIIHMVDELHHIVRIFASRYIIKGLGAHNVSEWTRSELNAVLLRDIGLYRTDRREDLARMIKN
jgi:hypothetical protein